jgi:hypothetical protein
MEGVEGIGVKFAISPGGMVNDGSVIGCESGKVGVNSRMEEGCEVQAVSKMRVNSNRVFICYTFIM